MQIQAKTLPRHLGLFGLWLLVVNGLIGAGIFGLPGGAAKLAREYSSLLDVAASLFVLLGTALYFLARHQARHIN